MRRGRALLVLAGLGMPLWAAAAVWQADPADYRTRLKALRAGDELRLVPGVYRLGLPVHKLRGRAGMPIVITAADPTSPPVFHARPDKSTVSIADASHVEIRGLVIDGRGLESHGVKCEGDSGLSDHITLEALVFRGHAANQQIVAISTKCPAWRWVIRGNRIDGAGTGLYLGKADGSAPFVGGVIEGNLVTRTLGYNLEIKHQRGRSTLAGVPAGGEQNIIRHNLFSKAEGASAGLRARPNVLVGDIDPPGQGAEDLTLVYGNVFYLNPGEALFQGEGNLAIYNNVFVSRHGDGVHVHPHNGQVRALAFFHNTLVVPGVGLKARRGASGYPRWVAGNLVFAALPVQAPGSGPNRVGPHGQARNLLRAPHAPLGELDLGLKREERLQYPPLPRWLARLPDAGRDIADRLRENPNPGAVAGRRAYVPPLPPPVSAPGDEEFSGEDAGRR